MVLREQLVAYARSKIGIRWKHQGRSDYGIDCAGLVIMAGTHCGLIDFDFTRYSPRANRDWEFFEAFKRAGCSPIPPLPHREPFPLTHFLPGDIVVLAYGKYPMHCGLYTKRNGVSGIIHSSAVGRRVREEDLVEPLTRRVFGGFRFPGIS